MKSLIFATLAILISILCVSPGFAQSGDEKAEEAKEHFDSGVALYQEGKYASALMEFNKSYELHPHWQILYNIGMCCLETGNLSAAAAKLSYFVEEGGGDIAEDVSAEVAATLKELRSKLGVVRLSGEFEGTALFIDGTEEPRGGSGKDVFLDPGVHHVKLLRGGEVIIETDIALNEGEGKDIYVTGAAAPGSKGEQKIGSDRKGVEKKANKSESEAAGGQKKTGKGSRNLKIGAWTSLGLALAILAAGAVTGGLAIHEKNEMRDVEREYNERLATASWDVLASLREEQDDRYGKAMGCAIASTVFFVAGGVAAAVSIVLFPLSFRSKPGMEKSGPTVAVGLSSVRLTLKF